MKTTAARGWRLFDDREPAPPDAREERRGASPKRAFMRRRPDAGGA